MRKISVLVAIGAVLAITIAGCGDSDGYKKKKKKKSRYKSIAVVQIYDRPQSAF